MRFPREVVVASDLVQSRPTGFQIKAAGAEAATLIARLGEVGDGLSIWMSEGLSNSFLIVTPAGRVVINTGMGFEGPIHRSLYDTVDDGPIRYVLLTQGHVDHVGGVDRFLDEGTEVVAQEANAACQADDARIHAFRVRRSMPYWMDAVAAADRFIRAHAGDGVPTQSQPTPTLTFRDRLEVELGGLRLEMLSVPGGETIDSACVWLPDHGVAFVGNLFSALFGHVPNLVTMRGDRYRFVEPFLESLERVRALRPSLLLTGHFGPIAGAAVIDAELVRIGAAVRELHDQVLAGMNRGTDLWTLMAEVRLPEELSLGEGYGKIGWAVRAIWESYAGWFHARSTTELYPVPAAAVAPDLVALAGGIGPMLARAQARIDAGELVEALHLAEIAEQVAPEDPEVIATLLAAHHGLLAEVEGQNFWETGWLRTQIATLGRRSAGA
ncbi:MAG: MBL fold metallo-hydrolase [Acidimicrobiia bacterium]|nr:MBL fold metallo-hydrolase [Acidimicrobiia bacterium]